MIAASTITFGSNRRASAIAASRSSGRETLEIPIDEPPRAGLTNSGIPRSSCSAFVSFSVPGRKTTCCPIGSPAAPSTTLVNSLSIPAALANTPGPTYGSPESSSSPWMVPSSANVPCMTGNTTSIRAISSPALSPSTYRSTPRSSVDKPSATCGRPASTTGISRSTIWRVETSSVPRVHVPVDVIPTGMTSYRDLSR